MSSDKNINSVIVTVSNDATDRAITIDTGVALYDLSSDQIDVVTGLLERITEGDYLHMSDIALLSDEDIERLAQNAAINEIKAQDTFDMYAGACHAEDDLDHQECLKRYRKVAERDKATADD